MILRRRTLLSATLSAFGAGTLGCSSGDPNEASFWLAFGGKPRDVVLALVDAFHAKQNKFRIKPVFTGEYFETLGKLRTAFSAGLAPALTHVVGEAIPYLADAGAIERLDRVPELQGSFDFVPALAEAALFPGARPEGTFSVPFGRSTPIAYLNTELFARAGLSAPATWDELREAARALTKGSGTDKRFGYACAIDWWFWTALVAQAGGSMFDDAGAITLGGDAGVEALQFWQGLIKDDVMRPPPGRDYNAWEVVKADFVEQRAAMIWTSTAFLRWFDDHAKFPFATAPLPAMRRRAVPSGGTFLVMPTRAPEPQKRAAAAFLAFMLEPDNANRFATETGYIPCSRPGLAKLEASGYYQTRANDRVAVDQLDAAFGWPWSRSLIFLQREIVQPSIESAIVGGKGARQALADARRRAVEDAP